MNIDQKKNKALKIKQKKSFEIKDIDFMLDLLMNHASFNPDTPHGVQNKHENLWELTGEPCNLELPKWFDRTLKSDSEEYYVQQIKLWQEISGRDRGYDPDLDEMEEKLPDDLDPIKEPGNYSRKGDLSIENFAVHKIASGRIMLFSGLKPGDNAIEYGAGFGYTALDFARMGVNVDTVDISKYYCDAITKQSNFYKVNLKSHHEKFGFFPSKTKKYNLIWFYEAFHHCLNFQDVVIKFKEHLAQDGKVLMAAEPIISNGYTPQMPIDWGLRLDKLAVCATRWRGWFELGFNEGYIIKLFINNGFVASKYDCNDTHFGITYLFELRKNKIDLSQYWLPYEEEITWNGIETKGQGRWSKDKSIISLDQSNDFKYIKINAVNHDNVAKKIKFIYGDIEVTETFYPGQAKYVKLDAKIKFDQLIIQKVTLLSLGVKIQHIFWSNLFISRALRRLVKIIFKKTDLRSLGIFIKDIEYAR